ncbi:MAG TPA: hypothetical protein VG815_03270 [Chloroflexota bacterium]|jgi:hypothetical protein|nr:hypothetical protein [Chloroflexota bacterium]
MNEGTVYGRNCSRSYAVQLKLPVIVALLFGVMIPWTAATASGSNEQPYPISASLGPGLHDYLTIETSPGVFSVQYHYGHVTPAANGAYLSNVTAPRSAWYIEDQRYGDTDVIAGVLHDDIGLIKTGLKMFDFGLYREAPNGTFPGSFGLFHGVAMFLAAAAPAMLVLQNWNRATSQMGSGFKTHFAWEIDRMDSAARSAMASWWNKPGRIDDGGKEERAFEAALALEATGWLAHDSFLQSRAQVYAGNGLRMTQSDGVWTEHGENGRCCHDSTYQAIGLVYGTRYLELMDGTPMYSRLYPAVLKGEHWEISRVRSNGTIITTGDSRTAGCAERSQVTGKCKTTDLEAIFSALMRWGVLAGDQRFRSAAEAVWRLNLHNQHG